MPSQQGGSGEAYGYMTAINKCPHDEFIVALVNADNPELIRAMGADATPVAKGAKHQWLGPYLPFSASAHVPDTKLHGAVRRVSDGKFVVAKGVKTDGSLMDVSSTKKRVCQLFNKDGSGFAVFRATLSGDGKKVIRNDFYQGKHSPSGTACEQYFEEGPPAVEGRFVDVYAPGSCQFVIDDCTN